MKILMIIDRYIPIWGGAENQLKQLIPYFKNKGCEIKILTRRWYKSLKRQEIIGGNNVYRIGVPSTNFFSTITYLFGLLRFCIKNRKNIDIIHTHGAATLGAIGSFLGNIINKPNIAKIATAGRIPILQNSIFGKLILNTLKKSNAIICLSNEIYGELKSINIPDEKIKHIKNAVDHNRFTPAAQIEKNQFREKRNFGKDDPIILFSGRLVPRKGIDILIDVWPKVIKKFPNARLLIIGSGKTQADSLEEKIKNQCSQQKLSNIYFEGEVIDPEKYYSAADILVFPSKKEGFPNVLLEAMSCQLAIIASRIGGATDLIINNQTGILFDNEDTESLKEKIESLLNNKNKIDFLGKNARENISKEATFDKISSEYILLYKSIID